MTARDAERVARELCGLEGTATPLHGEADLNFRLRLADGTSRVVKLHAPGTDPAELALQDAVLAHLAGEAVPRLLARRDGVRVLSWLEGRLWAAAPADLEALGRAVARIDRALAGFAHPAMRRAHRWNVLSAPEAARSAALLDDGRRGLVEDAFPRFAALPLHALRHQVIHNDANQHNV